MYECQKWLKIVFKRGLRHLEWTWEQEEGKQYKAKNFSSWSLEIKISTGRANMIKHGDGCRMGRKAHGNSRGGEHSKKGKSGQVRGGKRLREWVWDRAVGTTVPRALRIMRLLEVRGQPALSFDHHLCLFFPLFPTLEPSFIYLENIYHSSLSLSSTISPCWHLVFLLCLWHIYRKKGELVPYITLHVI